MKKNNKIVVYTAIANNYDDLINPKVVSNNIDYICFTDDNDLKSEIWNIIKFPRNNCNPIEKNRYVKLLPHNFFEEYDYSVYIDGSIGIIGDIEKLVNEYLIQNNNKLVMSRHPLRNCLYKEAEVCLKANKGNPKKIKKQIKKYRENNFPEGFGLTENGIIFRQHNDPEVIKLMEDWWNELINHSKRDQLSLSYILWKNDFNYTELDFNFRDDNEFFNVRAHKKKGIKRIWQLIKYNKDKNLFNKIVYKFARGFKKIIDIFRRGVKNGS